ncbi:MAG TPA: ring-cleaving dioxygenase [Anaerolineae bacterium]|nr:ring-cleaving dioxygenase [Anaerolineae bacterium]
MQPVSGLHHITAMASDPQRNLDFYQQILGQRLVKTTVNFDDPGTYHLYYGDEVGSPGTIMTFFPWPHARRGTVGNGETGAMAYTIPATSVDYWHNRLTQFKLTVDASQTRFGQPVLIFADPDGLQLELIATTDTPAIQPWTAGPVPAEHALRGFHGVTLWVHDPAPTAAILTNHLGYQLADQDGSRHRYQAGQGDRATFVDLLVRPGQPNGRMGAGSIHHIAFRTRDDDEQKEYLGQIASAGQRITPVQDRQYFHSIYFREPNGVLFEIATDPPGFTYDEDVATLGQSLKLPSWLESQRAAIEQHLPPLNRALETA